MFTAALFTITKTQKQHKCPSTDEWIKKMLYAYNELLLSYKNNEIIPFAAIQMNLEIIILSEISQRKARTPLYHLYVESKKNDTNELIYKTEIDSQIKKTTL